jgi:hypothetical protein
MKFLALLLLLTSCAPLLPRQRAPLSEPINQTEAYRLAFDGHPPVVVLDLEAAPDSITTVVAEYYYLQAKKRRHGWLYNLFH